jgi:signal transduction histidine kinase
MFNEERLELERVALHAGARVGPDFASGDPVELPADPDRTVGVYDLDLHLRAGQGPTDGDEAVRQAAKGIVADTRHDGILAVAVPITSNETIVGVARAAVPTRITWLHILQAWLGLAALAGLALVAAVLVAGRRARLLSAPLESLSDTAQRIANGDLAARAHGSRIPEIERVAETQNTMLDRLTELLDRERAFSTAASHQLRTPLTGLRLGLEQALEQAEHPGADLRIALNEANGQVDLLNQTIDDLLHTTRSGPASWLHARPTALRTVLANAEQLWHGLLAERGRRLIVQLDPDLAETPVPASAVAQILNVLIDNALSHGTGIVAITVRDMGDALAVDVSDEGTVHADPRSLFIRDHAAARGLGLPLARSIAEACGGRLHLARPSPARFTLLLPAPPVVWRP